MLIYRMARFVKASEVMDALGLSKEKKESLNEVGYWTFGDVLFSLVGNNEFLAWINEEDIIVTKQEFWDIVPADAYIDLEH